MKRWICSIALTVILARSVVAETLSPQQLFSEGMVAFQQQEYQTALEKFLQARRDGLVHSHLQYNLGVTYYKLGQYKNAIEALQAAAVDNKLAVFAYFNAGLAQLKMNDKSAAMRSFQMAMASTNDAKQQAWLRQSIDQLDLPRAEKLSARTRLDMGFNDNVRLQDEIQQVDVDQEDNYYALSSSVDWPITGRVSAGLNFYALDYMELNEFDYLKYGIISSFRLGDWRFQPAVNAAQLDNDPFFNQLEFTLYRTVKLINQKIIFTLHGQQYSKLAQEYRHLTGNLLQGGLTLQRSWRPFLFSTGYQYEYNDRDNVEQNGLLLEDFSPQRHLMYVSGKWRIKRFDFSLRSGFRLSRYDIDQQTQGRDPREDIRTSVQFNVYRTLGKGWWLLLDAEWLDNDSNLAIYSFDSSRVSFGLIWNY